MRQSCFSLLIYIGLAFASYAPEQVKCPDFELVRKANGLAPEEKEYFNGRKKKTNDAFLKLLKQMNINGIDPDSILTNRSAPVIAIAVSGGGYRAMLSGAGALSAFDERTEVDQSHGGGGLGGLLQATDYISGLSGGSWLVGSIAVNDNPTIQMLQYEKDLWYLNRSLIEALKPGSLETVGLFAKILSDTEGKKKKGFPTSITDQWGLLLAYQLINGTNKDDGNVNVTWSGIQNTKSYKNFEQPFPIAIGMSLFPGTSHDAETVTYKNPIIEMSPVEWGSWDKGLQQFVKTKWLGSNLTNGKPGDEMQCFNGFDRASLIMGTSSSVFNINIKDMGFPLIEQILIEDALKLIALVNDGYTDSAVFSPNPFKDIKVESNLTSSRILSACDGGYDGEVVPLMPFTRPERKVDFLIAVDADRNPIITSGENLRKTQGKMVHEFNTNKYFPQIPTKEEFEKRKLHEQPFLLGCDTSKLEKFESTDKFPPLIMYFLNRNLTAETDWSTLKLSYTNEESEKTITNFYNIVTQKNGTLDPNWNKCVGCAALLREFQRQNISYPPECKKCYDRYCFN